MCLTLPPVGTLTAFHRRHPKAMVYFGRRPEVLAATASLQGCSTKISNNSAVTSWQYDIYRIFKKQTNKKDKDLVVSGIF